MKEKKVLILGGGIAGVEAAIQLRKKGFEVSLISNRDFLYVYPISIWIPTISIVKSCLWGSYIVLILKPSN